MRTLPVHIKIAEWLYFKLDAYICDWYYMNVSNDGWVTNWDEQNACIKDDDDKCITLEN